ncbi:MAG: Gfo/Idh/MocA family oxidoreductase [Planctomycetota bacterium]
MKAAIVGVGFMGWIHYLAYQRSQFAELVGFATRDPSKQAGDWRSIEGNFGPPGEQIDISGMHVSGDMDDLLSDDSIEIIDICLPPHLHAAAIESCLEAGKFVLCEKPMTLDSQSAYHLVGRATNNRLMIGHILPFMPEFRFLVDVAEDRRYGNAIAGRFQRTIGPPDWIPDFYDLHRVGGPLIDLQVHDAHLIRLLFGMPSGIHTVHHCRGDVPSRYETLLQYSTTDEHTPPVVSVAGGVINSPARGFSHGYEVSFDDATVRFEFAAYADGTTDTIPVTIMHRDGRVERPELGSSDPVDAFVDEIDAAANVLSGGPMHPALDPTSAADALRICEMQMPSDASAIHG